MSEDLESLNGVGSSIASKLRAAGYTTIEALAVTPPSEIMEKTNIGFNTILRIQKAARDMISADFKTAKEFYEKRKNMMRCTTGSRKLDEALGGGIETQALTEFIGEYGSGKTQLCLMLSVTAQLPFGKGGLNGNVAFIDTEGTFMPERIYQIASSRSMDPESVADNILVARAYNSSHQCLLIDRLFTLIPENNIKLVVIDSMISHFRGEYIGRENLAERQQKLNKYLHKLIRLSEAYNIAVVLTNQVQANPAAFFGDPNAPAGGNVMAHACTHRVFLRKGSKNVRVARVIDSPYLPEVPVRFKITEKGIEDVDED
ncbi:DNA repair and recombination protein RadA [Candidatus Bathyarchaeota archaeon]|nr:MAG: DNA repair and recombination protein RadA [Candidatus Bathyarchaeota archaeon]